MESVEKTLYAKLDALIPDLAQQLANRAADDSEKSALNIAGVKDVHCIYEGKDGNNAHIITLYQYRETNGGIKSDPEYQIRIIPGQRIAEGLGYEQLSNRLSAPDDKAVIESLLDAWLSSMNNLGHHIYFSKEEELKKVRQTKSKGRDRNIEK